MRTWARGESVDAGGRREIDNRREEAALVAETELVEMDPAITYAVGVVVYPPACTVYVSATVQACRVAEQEHRIADTKMRCSRAVVALWHWVGDAQDPLQVEPVPVLEDGRVGFHLGAGKHPDIRDCGPVAPVHESL